MSERAERIEKGVRSRETRTSRRRKEESQCGWKKEEKEKRKT